MPFDAHLSLYVICSCCSIASHKGCGRVFADEYLSSDEQYLHCTTYILIDLGCFSLTLVTDRQRPYKSNLFTTDVS
jgi:hypothetical protein